MKISKRDKMLSTKKRPSVTALLPGVNAFYETQDNRKAPDSSSDDEIEDQAPARKRTKKLTPSERAELARQEEARIVKIEQELADSTNTPQSADQFDRVLLAEPNSSEMWLKYMALHVSTAELEKARAVGKRALDTINMTMIKDKFNIWIALLNLENLYGTKDSFNKLFDDAVKYNDSFEIYLSVIKMLASSAKHTEMEDKIKKFKAKQKHNFKMWLELGQIFYTLNDFKEARNLKEAAFRSIIDKKTQFNLTMQFAIMEFQYGDLDLAIADFEKILDAHPGKVHIWTVYIDQLVKKKEIKAARRVLDRAICQKLPAKSMKTLFQKYLAFEEKHGTLENVEAVKSRASEYVNSQSSK